MLKIDTTSNTLIPFQSTTLKESSIFERSNLQQAIISSWDAFCSELGFEDIYLIGEEISPHDSCRDRIDILALDGDGHPVVFELKRHRDKLQLLQAISYAAMLSHWDAEAFEKSITRRNDEQSEELLALLRGGGFELQEPRIVLLAESFDPEVILASDWLANFGVDISAYAIAPLSFSNETFLSIDQRFPLLGVDDVYTRRGGARRVSVQPGSASWDEVISGCEFDFAAKAVEVFRRRIEGSPHKRAFFSIFANTELGRMSIRFRRKYLKVYTNDQTPESEQTLHKHFGNVIPLHTWGSEKTRNAGFTFTIENDRQFRVFLKAVGEAYPEA